MNLHLPGFLSYNSISLILALTVSLGLNSGCIFESRRDVVDNGGSSETTNGLVLGYVRHSDGTPAQNVIVTLRPRDFLKTNSITLPNTSLTYGQTVTDAKGKYTLDSVGPGDYLIEANDRQKLAVVRDFSAGDKDTIFLDSMLLKPMGVVVGNVDEFVPGMSQVKVQIYGLDRIAFSDTVSGKFSFSDLPEGAFTLRASIPGSNLEAQEITGVNAHSSDNNNIGGVTISSFEDEDYGTWPYSLRVKLNTTSSGANIKENITNFPLLVRLNAENFNFELTQPRKVRFSGPSGKHLRYHIERWNAALKLAEIWVKMDIIHGNSNSDFITIHYGNPTAKDWTSGRRVFSTEDGFGGVWHLGEERPDTTTQGLYLDATPSAQNGDDRITSHENTGVVGRGHGFDAGDYIKSQPSVNLRPTRALYLSAWFRGKSTGSLGSSIVGLGDSYGLRVDTNGTVRFFLYKGQNIWFKLNPPGINVLDSTWHYLVGTFDGKFLRVYVDGIEAGSLPSHAPIPYTLGPNIYIGRHGNANRSFDLIGSLDEVQIHSVSRSPDWIKLNFESQRILSTLLEFPTP